jgi:hypothetical protein
MRQGCSDVQDRARGTRQGCSALAQAQALPTRFLRRVLAFPPVNRPFCPPSASASRSLRELYLPQLSASRAWPLPGAFTAVAATAAARAARPPPPPPPPPPPLPPPWTPTRLHRILPRLAPRPSSLSSPSSRSTSPSPPTHTRRRAAIPSCPRRLSTLATAAMACPKRTQEDTVGGETQVRSAAALSLSSHHIWRMSRRRAAMAHCKLHSPALACTRLHDATTRRLRPSSDQHWHGAVVGLDLFSISPPVAQRRRSTARSAAPAVYSLPPPARCLSRPPAQSSSCMTRAGRCVPARRCAR